MGLATFSLLRQWGLSPLPAKELFCIAGPCAAESEEQIFSAAEALKTLGVSAFRAGAWKPRTRPGSFEGRGVETLRWLAEVKSRFGLPIATEVATPTHVEQALANGIDILWIGARTTANPFLVQELANALKGTDAIVMVKNPISPELNLWIGAIERIMNADITRCAAILRGFSSPFAAQLRNEPGWHAAIDLRQRMPLIPLFCDPSHIAGRRDKLLPLSQQALNLDFDGIMVEVHPNPDAALSDSKQQLTPADFNTLLSNLQTRLRNATPDDEIRMRALRARIDELDSELLVTIAKRMDAAAKLGLLKREQNLTVLQSQRWTQVLEQMREQGAALGLPSDMVDEIAVILHRHAIGLQQEILEK